MKIQFKFRPLALLTAEDECSTLFILMDYPIHIDTISMELSNLYFKGSQVKTVFYFHSQRLFSSKQTVHYAAFHLGLHCLPKYLSTSIQNEKG